MEQDFKISFLAQGEYNKNYILEDNKHRYVLRMNFGSQIETENQIEYEYNTLKCLRESGVTPIPYFCDGSCDIIPQGIMIMQFLKGRPLSYSTDIVKAAHIFACIHSLDINEKNLQGHIFEKNIFSDRIKEADTLLYNVWDSTHVPKEIKTILYKVLDFAKANAHKEQYYTNNPLFCINNTEVNSHNFIMNEESTSYLIDWEKAVVTDPCQDIMHFLAKTTTLWKTDSVLNAEQKELFFKEYELASSIVNSDIRERVHLFQPYLYLRAISWCAFAYVEYQSPDKAIQNADTYNKIKEYLDQDFLEDLFNEQLS